MAQEVNWLVFVTCAFAGNVALAAESGPPGEVSQRDGEPAPAVQADAIPSLQFSNDFVSPELAFGDYRPMGQVQSRGVRVAPFTIRAAVQTGAGYNDNVTLSQTNRTGSMFFTLSPSLTVGLEGSTQRYYAAYRGNYGVYPSSTVDNYADHNLGLSAANEWTSRFRTSALYDYFRGHAARGVTGDAVTEPERFESHALRGSTSYGAAGAQGRVDGNFAYNRLRYITSRATTAPRDYDRFEVGGAFSYRVAPRTRAVAHISRAAITHPNDPSLDSTEMRYLVGATWDAFAKVQGTAHAGYMTKSFDSAARGDFSGPTFDASVRWSPLTYSVVQAEARRTFGESVTSGSTFVVANRAALSWTHAWADRVQSTVGYAYGKLDQQGIARTDTYQSLALRGSYALQRNVRVGAEFRRDTRDSDLSNFNYTRNITLVTIETAL